MAIDSLKKVIATADHDTTVVLALEEWDYLVYVADPDMDLELNFRIDSICTYNLSRPLSPEEREAFLRSKAAALNNIGIYFDEKGNYGKAVEIYTAGLKISEEVGQWVGVASFLNNIGAIYRIQMDYDSALSYFKRSLAIEDSLGRKEGISTVLHNIGEIYQAMEQYETAIVYYNQSIAIDQAIGDSVAITHVYNNLGTVYTAMEDYDTAYSFHQMALDLSLASGYQHGICLAYVGMGNIHQQRGAYRQAIRYHQQALALAMEAEVALPRQQAAHALYEIFQKTGRFKEALAMHELFVEIRDSLDSEKNQREVLRHRYMYEYDKQAAADSIRQRDEDMIQAALLKAEQMKAEKSRQRNWFLFGGLFLALLFLAYVFNRYRVTSQQKEVIEQEKKRSEELLLNILPVEIARELRDKGVAEARQMDHVTVMFTDFKGFTTIAEQLSPKDLVKEINVCFSAFDQIVKRHGVEKIKTIGDAYMAAGGLPVSNGTHPVDVVKAAIGIVEFMEQHNAEKKANGEPYFEIRVGIHSGPVVAGIVGLNKFQYDIWGDTVNTASRMESSSEIGKINISGATRELVKSRKEFSFESRGKIEVKGKGELEMFFVGKA